MGRFGTPVPRDYSKKQNRKERQLAIKSAYSHKALENAIIVLEELVLETPKTKDFIKVLEALKIADKKILLVVKEFDENVILATRNLDNVFLVTPSEISALDLVGADYLVVTKEALSEIEEVLA